MAPGDAALIVVDRCAARSINRPASVDRSYQDILASPGMNLKIARVSPAVSFKFWPDVGYAIAAAVTASHINTERDARDPKDRGRYCKPIWYFRHSPACALACGPVLNQSLRHVLESAPLGGVRIHPNIYHITIKVMGVMVE